MLTAVHTPTRDETLIATLRSLLQQAEDGTLLGLAAVMHTSTGWRQIIVGETSYNDPAALNLRIDILKAALIQAVIEGAQT